MESRDDRGTGPSPNFRYSIADFRWVIGNFPSPICDLRRVIQLPGMFFACHSPRITLNCFWRWATANPPTRQTGSSSHAAPSIADVGKCVTRGVGRRPFLPPSPFARLSPLSFRLSCSSLVTCHSSLFLATSDFGLCFSSLATRHWSLFLMTSDSLSPRFFV